jgi:ubiquitin C-terminal hydrolase
VSSGSESGPVDEADVSIYDCFRLAEEPETLEEDNAWYCPSCKDFVLAKKQMMLYKAPKILIVYFKRFKAKGTRGLFKSKLTTYLSSITSV